MNKGNGENTRLFVVFVFLILMIAILIMIISSHEYGITSVDNEYVTLFV